MNFVMFICSAQSTSAENGKHEKFAPLLAWFRHIAFRSECFSSFVGATRISALSKFSHASSSILLAVLACGQGGQAHWLMDARSTKDSSALRPAYRAVFPPNKRLTEQSTFTSWPLGKAGRIQSDWFHIKFVCDNEMGVDCWCAASQQPFFLWGIVAPGVPQKSWEVCAAGCLKLKTHLNQKKLTSHNLKGLHLPCYQHAGHFSL